MSTICFWLNNCVFPRETMQFPQSMVYNSFNLTRCDHTDKVDSDRMMIGYADTFIDEGYDDMETVGDMTFEDLMFVPMKSGHAQRTLKTSANSCSTYRNK